MASPKSTTRAELSAEKMRLVRRLLNEALQYGEIKRAFALQFKCQPRSAEPFLTKVLAEIRAELGRTIEEHRGNSYAFNAAVAGNTKLPMPVRQAANREVNKLLGLYAAVKVAPTTVAGVDLPQDTGRRRTLTELDAELSKFATGAEPEPS